MDFYVTPTHPHNQTCPGQPCYSLNQYAQNITLFEDQRNISLLLLSGNHTLTHVLNITGIDELMINKLVPSSVVDDDRVAIDMEAGIYVSSVSTLGVYNISMISKDGQCFDFTDVQNITQYQVEMENVKVRITNDRIRIQRTSIIKCSYNGRGLYFYSGVINQATLQIQATSISQFQTDNTSEKALRIICPSQSSVRNHSPLLTLDIQGSSITSWSYGIDIQCTRLHTLVIQNTYIIGNKNYGVDIQARSSVNRFIVENTHFLDNGVYGIGVHNSFVRDIIVRNTQFDNNGVKEMYLCSGLSISFSEVNSLIIQDTNFLDNPIFGVFIVRSKMNAVIKNTSFKGSQFGLTLQDYDSLNVRIQDTSFTKNEFGIVLLLLRENQKTEFENTISCQNCTIASNVIGIALNNFHDKLLVNNSRLHNNKGTPILAYQSKLELSGETSFENNTASRGGGLTLIYSTVQFANNSTITFRNNSAKEIGGAIYVVSRRYATQTAFPYLQIVAEQRSTRLIEKLPCFYQFKASWSKELKPRVYFINNTATLGGEEIYGAPLDDRCKNIDGDLQSKYFKKVFQFAERSRLSPVASDPTRVCFCDNNGRPQCKEAPLVLNETRYPGEKFNISLVLVGYDFGTVTGSIYAHVLSTDSYEKLGQNQHTQAANFSSCNNLVYSVHSKDSSEVIKLTASEQAKSQEEIERNKAASSCLKTLNYEGVCTALLTTPIYVNITLKSCPLGFKLNKIDLICECDGKLNCLKNGDKCISYHNMTCEIRDHKGYINREGTVWVGVNQNENNTNNTYYLLNRKCPHNYCMNERIAVDLIHPDSQCNQNHAGNLCGQCKDNYSLLLGSDWCAQCKDNNGLALLILFAAAGFLLVFFIKFLDLTVAHGTINGLILYANIVWKYTSILFPVQNQFNADVNITTQYSVDYYILTVPIAWLNLDFGFEMCFFEEMDAYTKTWLQFVFPVYIWSIAGLIILVSHYSTRATRLFGNNSISVLATLFLLSYGKLIRNISNIFTFVNLKYSDRNETLKVWSVDGTMDYWEPKHVVLFIVGLTCSIFLWLPYTLTLLLVPCLKWWDHLKPLRWINKLKPFYDAYYGPFKDKIQYQCWIGVLLIVRGIALVIFANTSVNYPNANILFLVVIAIVLLMYSAMVGLLYKKWYISLLENLYILNLGILGGGFLFTQINSQDKNERNDLNPAAVTSISLAVIQFVCIVVFHLVYKCLPRKACVMKRKEIPQPKKVAMNTDHDLSYHDYELRESLLEGQ